MNQYVNPIGLANIGWKFYIFYVVILVVESIIAYGWFIETKGRALEEIAVLFDGEEADVQAVASEKLGDGGDASVETREYVSPKMA